MISDLVLVLVYPAWKIALAELALHNDNSVVVILYLENIVKVYVCQMCTKYAKTKCRIMKHYERVQPVGLISLSCNWAILHNEIDQMEVKIQ